MHVDNPMFESNDWLPHNQRLPVLRHNNLAGGEGLETLSANNRWSGIWTDGVFDYHHYHTGAHEVLFKLDFLMSNTTSIRLTRAQIGEVSRPALLPRVPPGVWDEEEEWYSSAAQLSASYAATLVVTFSLSHLGKSVNEC